MRAPNEDRRLTYIVTGNEYAVTARSLYLLTKTVENIKAGSRVSGGLEKATFWMKKEGIMAKLPR
jgi:hypothetical protein